MSRLLSSLGIVIGGLLTGYVFRLMIDHNLIKTSRPVGEIRKTLQKIALLGLNPIAFIGAIWVVEWRHAEVAAMPFIGMNNLIVGGILAFLVARLLKMSRYQTGAYIVCGSFANIGSIGGLVCYYFFGEPGFALVSFYKLLEEFLYYAVGFPIAKSFSSSAAGGEGFITRLKIIFTDIFVLVLLGSIWLGFVLNLSGLPRPEFYQQINFIVIPLSSFLLLVSIGMALKFQRMGPYLKPAFLVAAIKFVVVPLIAIGFGTLVGLGKIDNGLPLKVVAVLAAMPVGFIAMVPPTIYDLDVDLANTCWIVTTAMSTFIVLPIQYFVLL
ncbi:MAG TPA: hypothetical protein GXX33_07020 [Firmicutes bacterium]|nr:hypothetical protein [Bacillota bacterium]